MKDKNPKNGRLHVPRHNDDPFESNTAYHKRVREEKQVELLAEIAGSVERVGEKLQDFDEALDRAQNALNKVFAILDKQDLELEPDQD